MQADIAAAILLEKIVRDTYPSKKSSAIQPLQWSILRFLQRAPNNSSDLTSMTKFLGLTLAPVSRAVQTLVKRGLVAKKPNPKEARSKLIELTAAGLETLNDDPILKVAQRIETLPDGEREQFRRSLQKLVLNAVENGI